MLFITKLYHRTKYLFNKKKRIENLQWIVIGVRRRSRVRFIPSIETTTKTKDTAETETISPWSSKHSNNTRQYESSSSRPSYVLIVIVGFRALEHLYLSESFLKCCIEFASLISHTLVLSLNMHRTNYSTTYYSWFKIMKHYFSLILKSYSLSLSLWNHWTRFSNHFFFYWILFSQSDSVNLQNVQYTFKQTRTEEWVWYVDSTHSCVVCEENARFRDEIVDERFNFLCFSVFEDETSHLETQIQKIQEKQGIFER